MSAAGELPAEVWMENGTLPAGQDIKVPRDAVGQHLAQGWSVREDQSDAAGDPSDGVTPAPAEPVEGDETSDPPAEVEQNQDDASGEQAAQLSTDKKGKR